MMNRKLLLTLLAAFFLGSNLLAQVLSPDFLCVRNDTLYWSAAANSCGDFISYDIYFSENETGPFQLLTEVTDANQDNYFHENSGGGVLFYYLSSNYDCPGEPILLSDTLDNLQPPVPIVAAASVTNGAVELNWDESNAPEVVGYIVFRETEQGVVAIDTVFGTTSYTDFNAAAATMSESYFVLALDGCGNTSVFNEEHRTAFLQSNTEDCSDFINLTWTSYVGWAEGVEKYEIYLSGDGNAEELVAEVDGNQNNFDFPDPTGFSEFCFSLKAVERNGSNVAFSNKSCVSVSIVQAERQFDIKNISVRSDNVVIVDWMWNGSTDLEEYDISRAASREDFMPIFNETVAAPFPNNNRFFDETATPQLSQVYYTVSAADECDNLVAAAPASSIFLEGNATEGATNLLEWTALNIPNATVNEYNVFLLQEGSELLIGSTIGSETSFLYEAQLLEDRPEVCYVVSANSLLQLPDGSEEFITSRSNEVCVKQNSRVHLPNAFAPEGINREFKPVVLFPDFIDYEMQVYDRYGKMLFVTKDVNQGWNGTTEGQGAPQGVYVYLVKVTQENGKVIEKNGTVLLLR